MSGREIYVDSDLTIDEGVYSGDIFEAIGTEIAQSKACGLDCGGLGCVDFDDKDLKQIDELAKELREYELIRINKC